MSAAVTRIEDRAERRAEIRWLEKLRRMGAQHHSMLIELTRIASLGDEERARALRDHQVRLNSLCLVAGELLEISLERACEKKNDGERLDADDPPEHLSHSIGRVVSRLEATESEDG